MDHELKAHLDAMFANMHDHFDRVINALRRPHEVANRPEYRQAEARDRAIWNDAIEAAARAIRELKQP